MTTHNIKFCEGKRKIKYYCNGKKEYVGSIDTAAKSITEMSLPQEIVQIKFSKSAKPEQVDEVKN